MTCWELEAVATSPSSHCVQLKAGAGTLVIVKITGSLLAPDTQRLKRTVLGGREESPRRLLHSPAPRPRCQGCTVPGAWTWRAGCPAPSEHLAAAPRDRAPALRSCSTSAWAAGKPGPRVGGRRGHSLAWEPPVSLGDARQLGRRPTPSNAALCWGCCGRRQHRRRQGWM